MDFSKLVSKNGIYLYEDNDFNTITIKLNFLAPSSNRDCAILDVLCEYLGRSNKKFNSDDDIIKKQQELYDLELNFANQFYSNQKVFSLYANLISMNAISDDYSADAFGFLNDMLRHPNFDDEEMLEVVKRNLLADLELDISDNEVYASSMYERKVIPEDNRVYENNTDIEYLRKMINSITLEDLKKEYEYIMKHFHSGLVFGNITQEQFNSFVDTMSLEPSTKKLNFDRDVQTVEGDIEVEKDSEQSYIYVTYDFDELTAAKLRVLNNIFNSSSGICYELLRDKYGLVYSFYVDIMFYLRKLYFYSEIDYSKKEKFLETLDEIIETLQDKEKLTRLLSQTKNNLAMQEYNLSENKDSMFEILNKYILEFYGNEDRATVNKQIEEMTEEDVAGVVKALRRKNVFMVRSSENE